MVYHYFSTKEALFAEIVDDASREAARLAADALRQPGSAWQRLAHPCGQMLDGVRHDPEYVRSSCKRFTSEVVPDRARSAIADYGRPVARYHRARVHDAARG